jgi:hypothetical protein
MLVADHQSAAYHPEQIDARADHVAQHPQDVVIVGVVHWQERIKR